VVTTRTITDLDYINFLVAAQCDVSFVKAAECYSENGIVVAHDKINRFLTRQSLPPETLWNEVERYVGKRSCWLTVIHNIHSKQIELTHYQWSGKHHKVVKGIGLITLVWTDGINTFPIDYRIYDKEGDEMSKNDHFHEMVMTVSARGFQPYFVMFDSWYSGIDNLKCVSKLGWNWFSRIKKNRMVNPDDTENRPVSSLVIPDDGLTVHMKKYGGLSVCFILLTKTVKTGSGPPISWPWIIRTGRTSRLSAGLSRIIATPSRIYAVSKTVRLEKKPARETTPTVLSALLSVLKCLTKSIISPSITPNGRSLKLLSLIIWLIRNMRSDFF